MKKTNIKKKTTEILKKKTTKQANRQTAGKLN